MDTIRYQLKTLNRQFQLASKNRTACSNNLIALLEQSYPGVRSLFNSPVRLDGSQKWVDFANTFWHVDCVAKLSLNAFTERYRKWCKRHGYNFSVTKAAEIHENARTLFPLVPKSDTTKLLVKEAITQLNTISHTAEAFRAEMNRLAAQLPEYETVMKMTGVGPSASSWRRSATSGALHTRSPWWPLPALTLAEMTQVPGNPTRAGPANAARLICAKLCLSSCPSCSS